MLPRAGKLHKKTRCILHNETASTTQQPRGEHRGTIKDCKIAGATTWQRQSNHTFTTLMLVLSLLMLVLHLRHHQMKNKTVVKVQENRKNCSNLSRPTFISLQERQ